MAKKKYLCIYSCINFSGSTSVHTKEVSIPLKPFTEIEEIKLCYSKWKIVHNGKKEAEETIYYLHEDGKLVKLCSRVAWDKNNKNKPVDKQRVQGYINRHLDYENWRDEPSVTVASRYKEITALCTKYGREFQAYFKTSLSRFMNPITGFNIVGFDDFIKCPENVSLQDHLTDKYGEKAMEVVKALL